MITIRGKVELDPALTIEEWGELLHDSEHAERLTKDFTTYGVTIVTVIEEGQDTVTVVDGEISVVDDRRTTIQPHETQNPDPDENIAERLVQEFYEVCELARLARTTLHGQLLCHDHTHNTVFALVADEQGARLRRASAHFTFDDDGSAVVV